MKMHAAPGARALLVGFGALAVCSAVLVACGGPAPSDCVSNSNCPQSVDATVDSEAEAGKDTTTPEAGADDHADVGPQQADGGPDGDSTSATLDSAVDTAVDSALDAAVESAMDAADGFDGFDGFTCDPTKSPHDAPCVVDEAYGVFVSTTGHVGASGTRTDPLSTIADGIAMDVHTSKARVYVCQGNYAEQVTLDAQHDGISLYGGLDCANGWKYTGTKAQVQAPSALYALRVDSTTKPIAIEDMGFAALDAIGQDDGGSGHSSVAVFVSSETAGVILRRVALMAGNAADGAGGAAPSTNLFSPDASDLQGNGAVGGAGGAAKDCKCKVWGDTLGGAGGNAGFPNAGDGGAGTASPPPSPQGVRDGTGGAGYPAGALGSCLSGHVGADGMPRGDAGTGGMNVGIVSAAGWLPAAGIDGLPGDPGQGGGGGGGGPVAGAGGGGCGGCGGAGGFGGKGGGASIALLAFNAVIELDGATATTRAAGNAGNASAGENGGGGGGGSIGACSGGAGGNGAGGQGGGGGGGGVSIGIVANATSRILTDPITMFVLGRTGTGGSPGGGGQGGSSVFGQALAGSPGTKGVDGISQPQLSP